MEKLHRVSLNSLQRFIFVKPNASILLFVATIVAMILANSSWSYLYQHFLDFPIQFQIGTWSVFSHGEHPMTMLQFVNDALMTLFFFLIGLEIKQEVLIGELSSARKAILPVVAAIGGMIVPVMFYLLVCPTGPTAQGAAIPMATDIAFALAVLGMLGKRVPLSLRIFLTALAVVDDIGGIIVIALFYSGNISVSALIASLVLLAVIYFAGKMKVRSLAFFYLFGFLVWLFFVESGIHSTIAGVLVAFTIPGKPVVKLDDFKHKMRTNMDVLDHADAKSSNRAVVYTSTQIHTLNKMYSLTNVIITPLQAIEHKLHGVVYYFILPLFAFVNTGVSFGDITLASLAQVPLAVFLGLFFGKTIGIYLFTEVMLRMNVGIMPKGMNRKVLLGLSMLGGIGFTVALFIANLSFDISTPLGADLLNQAKLGVFAGSFVSGVCGYLYLKKVLPKEEDIKA